MKLSQAAINETCDRRLSSAELVGDFMLRDAFDMVLVNDRRVYHGVTPITPLDPNREAYRDVLVITFKSREST